MLIGALIFSAKEWLPVALVLFAGAVFFTVWGLTKAPRIGALGVISALLKVAGAAALGLCLLNPLWTGSRAKPGANFFAILADNSLGMTIHDQGESKSRGEELREKLIDEKTAWSGAFSEAFQVRKFRFDAQLQNVKDFSDLPLDGRASRINYALQQITERFKAQPLAGILLFTDGNATDIKQSFVPAPGLPPVYPVLVGKDAPVRDIGIRSVSVTKTAFEDAPVTIQADVSASGYGGSTLVAQLYETAAVSTNQKSLNPSKLVSELSMRVARENEPQAFRFQIRPEKTGITFYTVKVSAKSEQEQFNSPEKSTEATLINNTAAAVVDRGKGPYRLLYVAGRPNWEFKFLNRAMEEDDQVQLTALIRVAKREPKFAFRGRAGESSNPLFRGFDRTGDDTEKYDQPVLVRLNISENNIDELRGGFPKTAEELYQFQAVILDDLEAGFFTHDQMVLLQRYVSERGGGVLMLGGPESLHEGKYDRTPIGEMLPVYLDKAPPPLPVEMKLQLTHEGWLQPWARLRKTEADEKDRFESMPGFETVNQVRGVKPGASVIATVSDGRGKQYPALAVQRFGRGRAAALMVADLWRWGLKSQELHADMNKSWRQMMRWIISDVPNRLDFQVDTKAEEADQPVQLQVRVRDKKFETVDNASVTINVQFVGTGTGSGTNTVKLEAEASPREAGLYEAIYVPREPGGYQAEAIVHESTGLEMGRVQAGWTADPAADEFKSLRPNRALLEDIARKTGGEMVDIGALPQLAAKLQAKKAPIVETWSYPVWHQSSVLLFALACLAAEWGLRRYKGLA